MVEVSTCTPNHFIKNNLGTTLDPLCERISDDVDDPLMEALNKQVYCSNRDELTHRAHSIAKLYGKKTKATQTLRMSFRSDKGTLKSATKESSTSTSSVAVTQTYLSFS